MTAERGIAWMIGITIAVGCGDRSRGDGESSGSSTTMADPSGSDTTTTGDSSSTGDEGGVDDSGGEPGDHPGPPLPCPDEFRCREDQDHDGKPLVCDNAPDQTNPDQGDIDFDSIGDAVDLCPTVQQLSNSADSDKDGIGNACDSCPSSAAMYNGGLALPASFAIVNSPQQGDFDRDGVGDACDNCPLVPNCLGFGDGPGLVAWSPGMPLDPLDPACNPDADADGIGDACEGMSGMGLAGVDDFDGDGIVNGVDGCPRIRTSASAHADPDGDGIGSECDVCPFVADPDQLDSDGDFIGDACEADAGCVERANARPIAFYDVAVGGYCCTTYYQGAPLTDPDGMPLSVDDLPMTTPGLLVLPPGCAEALASAGVEAATALGPDDVGGLDRLWDHLCLMPAWDQDLDAVPDRCDLCPFTFDPSNAPYVDANGMVWPNDGAYCNGEYACENQ